VLLVTILLRRGGLSFIVGIVVYFAVSIISSLATTSFLSSQSAFALKIMSLINPNIALNVYYSSAFSTIWTPSFSEVLLYVGVSYAVVAIIFSISYIYFTRRLNL
jgi:hypothetical protein